MKSTKSYLPYLLLLMCFTPFVKGCDIDQPIEISFGFPSPFFNVIRLMPSLYQDKLLIVLLFILANLIIIYLFLKFITIKYKDYLNSILLASLVNTLLAWLILFNKLNIIIDTIIVYYLMLFPTVVSMDRKISYALSTRIWFVLTTTMWVIFFKEIERIWIKRSKEIKH